MVTEIRIYFEGDRSLRQGFHAFLGQIVHAARRIRCRTELIATGARPIADFKYALKTHPAAWNILLLDSDGLDDGKLSRLRQEEDLEPLLEGSVFWMVQVMEAWFLADIDALKRFYGEGFQEAALRGNPHVEEIPKRDVYGRLEEATKSTAKGKYHETRHAPALLACIDPERVQEVSPNCRRLFDRVLPRLNVS